MIEDLLAHLFGEALVGKRDRSRRVQLIFRFFFGLLGAGLGVAGAVYFTLRTEYTENPAMRLSLIALFGFLASFWLFNVALGRTWRWPAIYLGLSFVAVFASRIFWGK